MALEQNDKYSIGFAIVKNPLQKTNSPHVERQGKPLFCMGTTNVSSFFCCFFLLLLNFFITGRIKGEGARRLATLCRKPTVPTLNDKGNHFFAWVLLMCPLFSAVFFFFFVTFSPLAVYRGEGARRLAALCRKPTVPTLNDKGNHFFAWVLLMCPLFSAVFFLLLRNFFITGRIQGVGG